MLMIVLLVVSICCLPPPFTPIGVGGLIAWGLLTMLFKAAGQGAEVMAIEIQSGNPERGGCWLVGIFAFVILGGLLTLAVFGIIAGGMRGQFQ